MYNLTERKFMKPNCLFKKTKNKFIELLQDTFLVFLFYIFRIFPIKQTKIVVSCFKNHGICDSPKYIIQELLKTSQCYDIVWLSDTEILDMVDIPIRQVPYHSFRGIYEQVTAHIWISNRRKSRYVRKRKNQFYIQTWHGGVRLKNVERAVMSKLTKRYCQGAINDSAMIDIFLSNSNFSTEIIRRDMWYKGFILQKGLPRNDIFIGEFLLEIPKKIKLMFGIPIQHNIVIYAPTFRSDMEMYHYYSFPYEDILNKLENVTNRKWTMLIHFHTNVKNPSDWKPNSNRIINVSAYEDIQELLLSSDLLISDYSSIISDYALLNKPILMYIPDVNEY